MLTKEERDGLRQTLIQWVGLDDQATVFQLFDDLDAKDAEIAALNARILKWGTAKDVEYTREVASEVITEVKAELARANERIAALQIKGEDQGERYTLLWSENEEHKERIVELERDLDKANCPCCNPTQQKLEKTICGLETQLTAAETALRVYSIQCDCNMKPHNNCVGNVARAYFANKEQKG